MAAALQQKKGAGGGCAPERRELAGAEEAGRSTPRRPQKLPKIVPSVMTATSATKGPPMVTAAIFR